MATSILACSDHMYGKEGVLDPREGKQAKPAAYVYKPDRTEQHAWYTLEGGALKSQCTNAAP
jgi:hypothetical protein